MTTIAAAPMNRKHPPITLIIRFTLLLISTMGAMIGGLITPVLPAMQRAFATEDPDGLLVKLVLTIPALFIVIGSPIAGAIIDRYGRKPLLLVATLIYAISGVYGYFAPDLTTLLISRAILGLAVGGVMTTVTTLIADYFEGPARSQFLGLQASFIGFGGVIFLFSSGYLANITWRVPFIIYASTFILVPMIIWILFEPDRTPDPEAINHPDEPQTLPIKLITFIYSLVLFVQITFNLIGVQLPFHLETLYGESSSDNALAMASMTMAFAVASYVFGLLARYFKNLPIIIAGLFFIGVGYVIISQSVSWPPLLIGLIMGGFGNGLIMPNVTVWLANETPASMRGRVLGGNTLALFLGQFISPVIAQPFIASIGIPGIIAIAGVLALILGSIFLIVGRLRRA